VVPGWGGTEGLAWISSTIPPMITGLGSTSARLLNGFCDEGGRNQVSKREIKVGRYGTYRAKRRGRQKEVAADGLHPPVRGGLGHVRRLGFFRGWQRLWMYGEEEHHEGRIPAAIGGDARDAVNWAVSGLRCFGLFDGQLTVA